MEALRRKTHCYYSHTHMNTPALNNTTYWYMNRELLPAHHTDTLQFFLAMTGFGRGISRDTKVSVHVLCFVCWCVCVCIDWLHWLSHTSRLNRRKVMTFASMCEPVCVCMHMCECVCVLKHISVKNNNCGWFYNYRLFIFLRVPTAKTHTPLSPTQLIIKRFLHVVYLILFLCLHIKPCKIITTEYCYFTLQVYMHRIPYLTILGINAQN